MFYNKNTDIYKWHFSVKTNEITFQLYPWSWVAGCVSSTGRNDMSFFGDLSQRCIPGPAADIRRINPAFYRGSTVHWHLYCVTPQDFFCFLVLFMPSILCVWVILLCSNFFNLKWNTARHKAPNKLSWHLIILNRRYL